MSSVLIVPINSMPRTARISGPLILAAVMIAISSATHTQNGPHATPAATVERCGPAWSVCSRPSSRVGKARDLMAHVT